MWKLNVSNAPHRPSMYELFKRKIQDKKPVVVIGSLNIAMAVSLLVASLVLGCSEKAPEGFVGSGTLEAKEVTLSAETSGTILALTREEGETVSRGDTLARIDVEKVELREQEVEAGVSEVAANRTAINEEMEQAKVNLSNVTKRFNRIEGLFEKGSATQQQYDDASTSLTLARSKLKLIEAKLRGLDAQAEKLAASLDLLKVQIEDGAITSPIEGIVEEKYTEVGEFARLGAPIYKLVDTAKFWLRVYISGKDLGQVVIGDTVTVRVDSVERDFSGMISWVSSKAEFTPKNVQTKDSRAELVYAVKVTLLGSGKELKIGMPAEVYMRSAGNSSEETNR